MRNRIKVDMLVRVNNLNSRYHGRKAKVIRAMGKVDAYDKHADCWEIALLTANGTYSGGFLVVRQNELIEWSREAAYVDSLDR